MLVGRSPALHPGDLQEVEAVYISEILHLVDVIVFPRVGARSIPSMLSAGYLDADIFCTIWDKRLLTARANYKPMEYTAEKEKELHRNVSTDDVIAMHIWFMPIERNREFILRNANVLQNYTLRKRNVSGFHGAPS